MMWVLRGPRPMMSTRERQLIESYLRPTDIMLEWGSEGSTSYFSSYVQCYFSIEHDSK
jgi:hypothetical protein